MTPLDGIAPEDFPSEKTSREDAARWYVARGIPVFAVCEPDGAKCTGVGLKGHDDAHKPGKMPIRSGWTKREIPSESSITGNWRRRRHNIAMPCGRMGEGYVVALDADGEEGARALADAEAALGALPPTLTVKTGRGRHLLFVAPEGVTDFGAVLGSLAGLRAEGTRLIAGDQPGLDLRGEGGYVVAPGSTHANGTTYTATGTAIAALPRPWWDALPRRTVKAPPKGTTPAAAPSADRYRAALERAKREDLDEIEYAPDGTQNTTINTVALRLFRLALGAGQNLDELAGEILDAAVRGGHPEGRALPTIASARGEAERAGPPSLDDRRAPGARGRRAEDREAEPRKVIPPDGRPRIKIGADVDRMADEAERAIGAHPAVYARHGLGLVHVIAAPKDNIECGAPMLEPLPRPLVVTALAAQAQWISENKNGDERVVRPDEATVSAVHARGIWPSARYIRGVTEAPALRQDGSIASAYGYDPPSGLFVHWRGSLDLPPAPTREDARRAYASLVELFEDFTFKGDAVAQGIARAAVIAAILTPLARAAIRAPVPMFMFDADQPNAGKTLLALVCGAIATGREIAPRHWSLDEEECEKRLFSIGLAGHPVALFDNLRVILSGAAIEKTLSATGLSGRVLGKSEDRTIPWSTVLYFTANAAGYSNDNTARVIHVMLRGRGTDRESTHKFKRPNLVEWVIDHRDEVLRAAFTILAAHRDASRPHAGKTLPKFEVWSRIVAGAIHWASGHDPIDAKPPENANQDANVARVAVLAWWHAFGDRPLRVGQVLEKMRERDLAPGVSALRDAFADLTGTSDPTRLTPGSIGKRLNNSVVDQAWQVPGRTDSLVTMERAGTENGSARYRVTITENKNSNVFAKSLGG